MDWSSASLLIALAIILGVWYWQRAKTRIGKDVWREFTLIEKIREFLVYLLSLTLFVVAVLVGRYLSTF